jgi:hypothetical protein
MWSPCRRASGEARWWWSRRRRRRSAGGGDGRDLQGGALRERGGIGGCIAEGDAADKIVNSYQMICKQK